MYQPDTVPEVMSPDLPAGAYLLDVRGDDKWAAGHAPDAVHVRLSELGARYGELPRDREVYVICRTGHQSAYAAQALGGAGLNTINVADGMTGWAVALRPMISETAASPTSRSRRALVRDELRVGQGPVRPGGHRRA